MERLRDFGEIWLALGLWRLLGRDTLLATKTPDGRAEVPWATVVTIPGEGDAHSTKSDAVENGRGKCGFSSNG